jgi:hypothetical protein
MLNNLLKPLSAEAARKFTSIFKGFAPLEALSHGERITHITLWDREIWKKAERFENTSVPVLLLFQNGRDLNCQRTVTPKSILLISSFIYEMIIFCLIILSC